MGRPLPVVVALALWAGAPACGGSPAPAPTAAPPPVAQPAAAPATTADDPEAFVVDGPVRIAEAAPAQGTSEAPAAPSADGAPALETTVRRDALELLFGSDWAAVLALPSADRLTIVRGSTDGESPSETAQVRLTASQVAALLSEPPARQPLPASPEPVRESLEPLLERAWQHRLCELRRQHGLSTAPACPAVDDLGEAVTAVAARLELTATTPNPIPLLKADGTVRLAQTPLFFAAWTATGDTVGAAARPLAGVHLAHPDNGELAATSDAIGRIQFAALARPLAEPLQTGPLAFELDRSQLAGPLAPFWPATRLTIDTRNLDPGRTLVHSAERRDGAAIPPIVAGLVVEGLRANRPGLRSLPQKPRAAADALALSRPARLTADQRASLMADDLGVDFVVFVTVDSDYASRLNTHRKWYEARADMRRFNLWTGELVASTQTAASSSGLGAGRADQAARKALVAPLLDIVAEWTKPQEPPRPSPPLAARSARRR